MKSICCIKKIYNHNIRSVIVVNNKICIYFNDLNSHYNLNFVEKTVNLNKYRLILC